MKYIVTLFVLTLLVSACKPPFQDNADRPLPILGERKVVDGDTVYQTIPDFSFIDQDSQVVNKATFAGKAYVVDFFFTFCPSICPKVKANMLDIYDKYKDEKRLLILSHTVAPVQDSVPALKKYAAKLGIESARWHLVTGDKAGIYDIAEHYYLPRPTEDGEAPGGFDHSGAIVLVDPQGRVRAFAQGTEKESVQKFMHDIDKLLAEMDGQASK
jgi:protein SCO1/2